MSILTSTKRGPNGDLGIFSDRAVTDVSEKLILCKNNTSQLITIV